VTDDDMYIAGAPKRYGSESTTMFIAKLKEKTIKTM
jgi:hypothetical protein